MPAVSAAPVRVAVVDDSALMRQVLSGMLNEDPGISVVGTARDPYSARELIRRTNPDVVTLDIEMPRMDGLTFLQKIMSLRPMPVVMISSLTREGAAATIEALELGAVDFVAKPGIGLEDGLRAKQREIVGKIKTASRVRVRQRPSGGPKTGAAVLGSAGIRATETVVAIGASTGGVEAIRAVLSVLPPDSPAILISQHMPAKFTTSFARRLDEHSPLRVSEARSGQRALPGHAYLAPGGRHLRLRRHGANFVCELDDGPEISGHRPSVDVLFHSFAAEAAGNGIGVILTGMGRDGAEGLAAMRAAGAVTIGQDERSCVVYGMPRAAHERGAVDRQLTLLKIPDAIVRAVGTSAVRAVRV